MVSGGVAMGVALLVVCAVYDSGSLFAPHVLDISEADLMKKFASVSVVLPKKLV